MNRPHYDKKIHRREKDAKQKVDLVLDVKDVKFAGIQAETEELRRKLRISKDEWRRYTRS
jgi:hypothetical protein